ncbi:ABC transporter substrate-binding protein [Arthrobacter bambusae]|uniref:ABC transporter substrate-binding protein n=1 Tax=Arthrobacter bambusae TaxID=1338426 RepID=UPI00278B8561|nr:ABC transporter substrate-binding protein [Arthrobacter bambusae]MDQ0239533.1 peptide/nickel transport system substrate-binding protein [Arthrobacter bambusae]
MKINEPLARGSRPRRRPAAAGLAVTAALLLSACSGGATAADDPRLDTVVYAFPNAVNTLDPVRADYVQNDYVQSSLYDSLVTYDKDGNVLPQLAKEATYTPDNTAITVKLREDATFHDGTKLTAKDVAFSLDRYSKLGLGIAGTIKNYKTAEITGDFTLTIRLSHPDALFMGALSHIYILNSALVTSNAGIDSAQGWLLNHDAGSGPYSFVDTSNGTYNVQRYDKYWAFDEKRPRAFTFRRIDENATARDELRAGNVDIVGLNQANAQALNGAQGITVKQVKTFTQAYVYFNNSYGPTANPAVRKAIRLAYDYQSGLDKLRGGLGTLASGPLPTTIACRPNLPESRRDLDQAKKILGDAGLTNITLTMRFQPAFPEQVQEATLLQSNLAEAGITLKLEPIAFADYLSLLQDWKKIPDLMLSTDAMPFPDPGAMLARTYTSSAVGTNRAAYANPKVDDLLAKANTAPDATARCGLYKEAQTLIDSDAAAMDLYTTAANYAFRKDLGDTVTFNSVGGGIAVKSVRVRQ